MTRLWAPVIILLFCTSGFGQSDLQQMSATEQAFVKALTDTGSRQAFLDFLADDSVIFQPDAVNGREYWTARTDIRNVVLTRVPIYSDIASNGIIGYTTGDWRLAPPGKDDAEAKFGQYVTVWEKRGGRFQIILDIGVAHDKMPSYETDRIGHIVKITDPNKRGWSPADASMSFLRMSMTPLGLAYAYGEFAGDDVRLLVEREPPILGKKHTVEEMKSYISVDFPKKVVMFVSADMGYTWNPCKYANSDEGTEKGNCLQIWKLRKKKWWIVVGVFAPIVSDAPPELKTRPRKPGL